MNKTKNNPNNHAFNFGHGFVEKPRRCEIRVCSCGNKYIKTRPRQNVCLKCMNKPDARV